MKTEDNIIKNLNSILSEQTMNSVFNDTDIINLVKNMKVEIEENIDLVISEIRKHLIPFTLKDWPLPPIPLLPQGDGGQQEK